EMHSLLFSVFVFLQATAQITGTVKDQSGAVLPGVEITATQTETGAVRTGVTNETGSYVLSNLPIGPYRLEAGLPGFRTFVQTGIVLQVNSSPA
ncbi:carboxypeptidase-like regulatory domain-containing protein, partial [Enterococcus casseliflavus]|uniref:carboxypeptidase-like regulatory domain-containing protein n=1 Tax=Enterococcus casseliflavus TaxID=37734 RepID=UPI003D09F317